MPLERIFLILVIVVAIIYAAMIAFAMIALLPWGLVGLAVLAFAGYVAWRLISEHANDAEDRHYDNIDR